MDSSIRIPDNFLPPQAPVDVRSRRLDFLTTSPPLPKYAGRFAAVIDNFLTEAECKELVCLAESTTVPLSEGNAAQGSTSPAATPTWERALVNAGNGKQVLALYSRNCGRIIWDSPVVAQRLFDRLRPFLREFNLESIENQLPLTGLVGRRFRFHLTGLNERLRFLKYEGGEYFRPHCDGKYETPDKEEISLLTIQIYLNGDGEQDLSELKREQERAQNVRGIVNPDPNGKLLGGATSFLDIFKEEPGVRVFPKTGSVLVFQQNDLLHCGDCVYRGTKYTVRTDVMYRREPITTSQTTQRKLG